MYRIAEYSELGRTGRWWATVFATREDAEARIRPLLPRVRAFMTYRIVDANGADVATFRGEA